MCNTDEPSYRENNPHGNIGKALREACLTAKDYTGEYPCHTVQKGFSRTIGTKRSIDSYIINLLLKNNRTKKKHKEYLLSSRTLQNRRYDNQTIIKTTVSKYIQKVKNNGSGTIKFLLRIQKESIKTLKSFETLSEAIVFRDNIVQSA